MLTITTLSIIALAPGFLLSINEVSHALEQKSYTTYATRTE